MGVAIGTGMARVVRYSLCVRQAFGRQTRPLSQSHRGTSLPVIDGKIDTSGSTFKDNFARNREVQLRVSELIDQAREGGGVREKELHLKRQKLLPRDRVAALLDPGTEFFELSPLAGLDLYKEEKVPCAGVIAGIGVVQGNYCMIIANDATVKGGTYYPIGVKKNLRALEVAMENRLCSVYLVDSGGAFLPMQSEIFADATGGGRMFYGEAVMSSLAIPQIAAVMGSCTAGGAYCPAMTDECVIVRGTGAVYLGGPPLVKAATGEEVTSEELGGADVHCRISGLTDHMAGSDEEALAIVRSILANVPPPLQPTVEPSEDPLWSADDISGLLPLRPGDMLRAIARITDGSRLFQFKPMYGPTLITGFARIQGHIVGIVANDGPLSANACLKGAHFLNICQQRGVPVVSLVNVSAFQDGGTGAELKEAGKMIAAGACLSVPRLTLIMGHAIGAAALPMGLRSSSPRFLFTYPTASLAATDLDGAAQWAQEHDLTDEQAAGLQARLQRQSEAVYGSARCWDDGVILPEHTRSVLATCLSIFSKPVNLSPGESFANFRM